MPDIEITDQLDTPETKVKVDLAHFSSLFRYLKDEILHLAVVPDFLQRKDKPLSEAATKPIEFQATVGHSFRLGNTTPEVDIAPQAQVTIDVNASPGTNLFDKEPFVVEAKVPAKTGYVGVTFEGSLDLGVSGSAGDLTFGFDKTRTIDLAYYKAFPLGEGEPALLPALKQTLGHFIIPADVHDLSNLGVGDIATVSGSGSLKVSGGVNVSAAPNPLASVNLPLGAGTFNVSAGATAGVNASLEIKGSYQVRARSKGNGIVELSYLQERGTTLKADFSASGGVTAEVGDTDLIAKILGFISPDPTENKATVADLSEGERGALKDAIKKGLDSSLQASFDAVLRGLTQTDAAFQYEIIPDRLTKVGSDAVHRALDGDLSGLTTLESNAPEDGVLAPGIRVLNSVFTLTRKKNLTLHLNLIGIINFISVSEFIKRSEVLTDNITGAVTIKETVSGEHISAIVNNIDRDDALRKALFDSVLVTTTYRAGKTIAAPTLACQQVHFAANQNTNHQLMGDYLTWFEALNLLGTEEREDTLHKFIDGGPSTCILRTSFNDHDCTTLFLDENGAARDRDYYLEHGRLALRALLDPNHAGVDQLRYKLVDDPMWPEALSIGANVNLAPLVGLERRDPRVGLLIGDVFVITQWADAMSSVGALVADVRDFVGAQEPATLLQNNTFRKKRDALQKKLAGVARESKARFDEPWGMVALFWAAGSPMTSYAKAVTAHLAVERKAQLAAAGAS